MSLPNPDTNIDAYDAFKDLERLAIKGKWDSEKQMQICALFDHLPNEDVLLNPDHKRLQELTDICLLVRLCRIKKGVIPIAQDVIRSYIKRYGMCVEEPSVKHSEEKPLLEPVLHYLG
jgi:hypothetical protein